MGEKRPAGAPVEGEARSAGLVKGHLSVTDDYHSDFEGAWALEIAGRIADHEAKAEEATTESTREWHAVRARGLRSSPLSKKCEQSRFVHCGCSAFAIGGCRQKTCWRCTQRSWGRVRKRVLIALETKSKGGWRLMTLGGTDRADFAESRKDLQTAWKRLRALLHKEFGASHEFWSSVEVGRKAGHIHLHVLCRWPKAIDYKKIGDWWASCYPGAGGQGVDFAKWQCRGCSARSSRAKRLYCRKRFGYNCCGRSIMNAKAGASYAAKYATKGAEFLSHAPHRAAEILAGLVGARMVRTSQRFWVKKVTNQCAHCGDPYLLASEADTRACEAMANARESRQRLWGARKRAGPIPIRDTKSRMDVLAANVAMTRALTHPAQRADAVWAHDYRNSRPSLFFRKPEAAKQPKPERQKQLWND